MKISPSPKNLAKFFALSAILFPQPSLAWTGYDYDNKTEIEIGPGNLVREGLLIQFYDSKADNYRTAKVLFSDEIAGGTRLQIEDLDAKKERTFIMQN